MQKAAILFLATGAGTGYLPVAPGTAGTLVGLLLWLVLGRLALPAFCVTLIFLIVGAVWIAHQAEKIFAQKDPGCIVIDEIVGILVTLVGLPLTGTVVIVGFGVFRLLDIMKPFPIRDVERRISGGLGIVIDDVIAGVMGNLLLRLLFYATTR